MPSVETSNLTKIYGKNRALDGVSFQVEEGEIFGLLGPNGAGKTTLIRILTTILLPTSGSARVNGYDVLSQSSKVRRMIGVVSQAMTSDLDLTARENLDVYGQFFEIPRRERLEKVEYLLDIVGLLEHGNELVASYSGGMRRRLEIARGLIHKPRILFLDEPTIGLDPQSRLVVWDLIRRFTKEDNITLFLTTHYMEEAETICNRIAIIDSGKIVALDSPDRLKQEIPGSDVIELRLSGITNGITDSLLAIPGVREVALNGLIAKINLDNGAHLLPAIIDELRRHDIAIEDISMRQLTLEDVFIRYTGKSIRDEEIKKVSYFIGAGVPRRM
ncbi:MAG TPA: ATP-binding cassette domain-containing protein [Nitrospiria bacterium]|nr:ATP-binding cassette domain-containing protein [Nitrospiria bacterium]